MWKLELQRLESSPRDLISLVEIHQCVNYYISKFVDKFGTKFRTLFVFDDFGCVQVFEGNCTLVNIEYWISINREIGVTNQSVITIEPLYLSITKSQITIYVQTTITMKLQTTNLHEINIDELTWDWHNGSFYSLRITLRVLSMNVWAGAMDWRQNFKFH